MKKLNNSYDVTYVLQLGCSVRSFTSHLATPVKKESQRKARALTERASSASVAQHGMCGFKGGKSKGPRCLTPRAKGFSLHLSRCVCRKSKASSSDREPPSCQHVGHHSLVWPQVAWRKKGGSLKVQEILAYWSGVFGQANASRTNRLQATKNSASLRHRKGKFSGVWFCFVESLPACSLPC